MNWFGRLFGRQSVNAGPEIDTDDEPVEALDIDQDYPLDLVDGLNAMAAYYRFAEADSYALSLHSVRERRDFRPAFISRIQELLRYSNDADAYLQIDRELGKCAAVQHRISPSAGTIDLATEARSIDPSGFALLGLSSPLTTESLKRGYRSAAKSHHPDVGGDNATMLEVNDAYAVFAALINRRVAGPATDAATMPEECSSASEVIRHARVRSFEEYVDDMAADLAYAAYVDSALPSAPNAINEVQIVSRLCELLAAAGFAEKAKNVLSDLRILVDAAARRDLRFEPYYERAANACSNPEKIRFVANHVHQADNLLRLGIIDTKRHAAILARVDDAEAQVDDDARAFALFVEKLIFLSLPLDPAVVPIPEGLVPMPDYYGRIETLSEEQRAEYANAFHGGRTELAEKYLAIRFDVLMRSVFVGYRDIGALSTEATVLSGAPGLKPTLRSVGEEATRMLAFLQTLPSEERKERIKVLLSLDADPRAPIILKLTEGHIIASSSRPIVVTKSYVDFATASIGRIQLFIRSGSGKTPEEDAADKLLFDERRAFTTRPYMSQRARPRGQRSKIRR